MCTNFNYNISKRPATMLNNRPTAVELDPAAISSLCSDYVPVVVVLDALVLVEADVVFDVEEDADVDPVDAVDEVAAEEDVDPVDAVDAVVVAVEVVEEVAEVDPVEVVLDEVVEEDINPVVEEAVVVAVEEVADVDPVDAVDAVAAVDEVVSFALVVVVPEVVEEDVDVDALAGTVKSMSGMSIDLLKSCRKQWSNEVPNMLNDIRGKTATSKLSHWKYGAIIGAKWNFDVTLITGDYRSSVFQNSVSTWNELE